LAVKRLISIFLILNVIIFGLPAKSYGADLIGPKVSQRGSTGFVDATDDGVGIDIYYAVEDESGVDETKVPDTIIRLPGNEENTSLRARPTLISGNIYSGSWLARFTYSKGIPPGIYVASTGTWYDTQNNPSLVPADVTTRVDNLNVTSNAGTNTKPTNLQCKTPEQIYFEEEVRNKLSASLFCTWIVTSLRNGYKIMAFIDQIPTNAPTPNFIHNNDEIVYPRVLGPTKIGKTFNITNTVAGVYVLRVILEFLDFPELHQVYSVKLSETIINETPVATNDKSDSGKLEQRSKDYYESNAKREISSWLKKVNAAASESNKDICFSLLKINLPLFSQDSVSNEGILKSFQNFIYGSLFTETIERIKTCPENSKQPSPVVNGAKKAKSAASKKTTITCIKGKLTKKVTAVSPKCPAGYKIK
jgi:hypothetical protein